MAGAAGGAGRPRAGSAASLGSVGSTASGGAAAAAAAPRVAAAASRALHLSGTGPEPVHISGTGPRESLHLHGTAAPLPAGAITATPTRHIFTDMHYKAGAAGSVGVKAGAGLAATTKEVTEDLVRYCALREGIGELTGFKIDLSSETLMLGYKTTPDGPVIRKTIDLTKYFEPPAGADPTVATERSERSRQYEQIRTAAKGETKGVAGAEGVLNRRAVSDMRAGASSVSVLTTPLSDARYKHEGILGGYGSKQAAFVVSATGQSIETPGLMRAVHVQAEDLQTRINELIPRFERIIQAKEAAHSASPEVTDEEKATKAVLKESIDALKGVVAQLKQVQGQRDAQTALLVALAEYRRLQAAAGAGGAVRANDADIKAVAKRVALQLTSEKTNIILNWMKSLVGKKDS